MASFNAPIANTGPANSRSRSLSGDGLGRECRRPTPANGRNLWLSDATQSAPYLGAFKEGLRERGWIDGRSIRIVERFDDGDSSRLPRLAIELVDLGVDVLFVTDFAVPAARQASTKIPIVCADFYDPVAEGWTRSIARPDGNVTGVSLPSRCVLGQTAAIDPTADPRPSTCRLAVRPQRRWGCIGG